MPFNSSGGWDRLMSCMTQKETGGGEIKAEYFDNDINDICNGLTQCITRDGKTLKPTADMNWNTRKITNLGTGEKLNDAATLFQAISAGSTIIYNATEITGLTKTFTVAANSGGILVPENTGMRIFVRFTKVARYYADKLKFQDSAVEYIITNPEGEPMELAVKEGAIREFIYYQTGSGTGQFRAVDLCGNVALNDLSNVQTVSPSSAIKDYVKYSYINADATFTNFYISAQRTAMGLVTIVFRGTFKTQTNSAQYTATVDFDKLIASEPYRYYFNSSNYCLLMSTDSARNDFRISRRSKKGFKFDHNKLVPDVTYYYSFTAMGKGE